MFALPRRLICSVLAGSLVFSQPAGLIAQSNLPSLGDDTSMSVGAERALGNKIARDLYRDPDYLADPVLDGYTAQIMAPLYTSARRAGHLGAELDGRLALEVFLIKDRAVNAFALPGGFFGVHLGLIAAVESPDELAAVMAHELSHATQRHIARGMDKQAAQTPWVLASILLAIVAARSNPNVTNAALATGQAGAVQGQLNFSRDMEREADRIGFGLMQAAGFTPQGFVSMFDKLAHAARLNDSGNYPYLRSHPMTSERIADAAARVQQLQFQASGANAPRMMGESGMGELVMGYKAISPDQHRLMRARAKVLMDTRSDALQRHMALAQTQSTLESLYAGTLAAFYAKDSPKTRALFERLQGQLSGKRLPPDAMQTLRWLAAETGFYAALTQPLAIQSETRAEVFYAVEQAMARPDAQALLATTKRLMDWSSQHPQDGLARELLSRAWLALALQESTGAALYRVRAQMAQAERAMVEYDTPSALQRYQAAQRLIGENARLGLKTDGVDAAIVDSRVRDLQRQMRELARER